MSGKKRNLLGQRFKKLIVIAFVEIDKWGGATWRCQCDCGRQITAFAGNLVRKNTTSCGYCVGWHTGTRRTHGLCKTPEYQTWESINTRARKDSYWKNKPKDIKRIEEEWKTESGPEIFITYLKTLKHYDVYLLGGFQLDRIDNNKGYVYDNLRIVTQQENLLNKG